MGQYVRMYGTERFTDTWGYSLWEFELCGGDRFSLFLPLILKN